MTAVPRVRPLWIARLAGSQEAMGAQHGRLAAGIDGSSEAFGFYPQLPERLLVAGRGLGPTVARLAVRAAKEIALAALERDRPPELLARSRAFMVAAGRPAADARFAAVMDLVQNAVGLAARLGAGPFAAKAMPAPARWAMTAARPACSSVIAWGAASAGGVLRHARNFDFPGVGVWDTSPALLLCSPDDGMRYAFVACRGGDVPAVTVVNQAGLTITTHTRFHRQVGWRGATIVDLVHEIGRRATTLAEAERIVRARPSSSSWGLAVSSASEGRAVVFEVHAGAVAVVAPRGEHLTCANRYRDPAMQVGEAGASAAWAIHSDAREARLDQLMAAARARGGASTEALAAMLADREDPSDPGVQRHLGGVLGSAATVHSVVVDAAAQTMALGVAPAPASEGRWIEVRWSWDGAVEAWEAPLDHRSEHGGVAVRVLAPPLAPRQLASDAVATAIRLDETLHDDGATAAALAQAIALAPADPSLRLAATWIALRRFDHGRAVVQARAGLAHERVPYRRGQLLLWGARAAAAHGDDGQASAWRDELEGLNGTYVDELRAAAHADRSGPPRAWRRRRPAVNLLMMDAQ